MVRYSAIFAVVITLIILAIPAFADGETAPAPQVRYSISPEKVRVVLDLPQEAAITDRTTPQAAMVTVVYPLAQPLPSITLIDPIVTNISFVPQAQGQAMLTVTLAKPRKCQVFTLPAADGKPFRVVVDVLKRFSLEEQRSLTPAIKYSRLEQQTDDRYFAAHLVEVDTRDPKVRCAVTAAEGERETVAAMVARTKAVCGVNGGYFLGGTRPVGLLKVGGNVLSLPLWGRTAAAFPAAGPPVFANPVGAWKITFSDGTVREMADWLDASVLTPSPTARVIPGRSIPQTPANPLGVTAIVRDGKVIARPTTGAPLQANDFALHLTGEDAKALDALLALDAAVTITPTMTPEWKDILSAVGAGPRLLQGGKISITGEAERFKPDILRGRHGRTGLGTTKDGHLLLAVIEEPCAYGGGATLKELAELLLSHGAVEAMNLDGGGSSTLGMDGKTVNYPAGAWVRPVASSVLVFDDRYGGEVAK